MDLSWATSEQEATLDNLHFKTAINRIAARLRGLDPNEMIGEEIQPHRKTLRLRNAAIATLLLLTIGAVAAAVIAAQQRTQALESLAQAFSETGRRLQSRSDGLTAKLMYAKA